MPREPLYWSVYQGLFISLRALESPHPPISHTSLWRPYTQHVSESHLEFLTCSVQSSPPLPPYGNINSGKTRRCKEVQKASTELPYGLASTEPCTHKHTQCTVHTALQVRQPSSIHSTSITAATLICFFSIRMESGAIKLSIKVKRGWNLSLTTTKTTRTKETKVC